MLSPQKGNSEVSFNNTLLNFGLSIVSDKIINDNFKIKSSSYSLLSVSTLFI